MSRLFLVLLVISLAGCYATNLTLSLLKDHPSDSACLDGSPYGYYYRPGAESNKWIIHHEGGGWCYTLEDCYERSKTVLGSSSSWTPSIASWGGLLNNNEAYNPSFYNWTVIIMFYCDGSSFSGSRADPVSYQGTNIYFRGHNNLEATSMDLLQNRGLGKATDVIITGCSAGGLATYLHADYWKNILPSSATVKAIADAGFFLDTKSVYGYSIYTPEMEGGFQLWNSTNGVNNDCIQAHISTNDTWRCIMAQYTYPHIKTPIFMVNSKYDSWQIPNIYGLPCAVNLKECNSTEDTQLLDYGDTFLGIVKEVGFEQAAKDGMWVNACYYHCLTLTQTWTTITVKAADGTMLTANQAFTNWYYSKPDTKAWDTCDYPCNPTCPQ